MKEKDEWLQNQMTHGMIVHDGDNNIRKGNVRGGLSTIASIW